MITIQPHIAQWALDKRNISDHAHVVVATTSVNTSKPKKAKKKERVLETKGGGGYQPPPTPTPQEQAEAREWEAEKEAEREEKRQDAIDAKEEDKKAASDAAWMSSKNSAYQGAVSGATSRLNALGLGPGDQYGVWDQVNNRYNTSNNSLAVGSDYSGAFAPSIVDEALGSARTGQRNKYSTAFNQAISPYYGEEQFGSTSDDAILSSILGQQYDDALADINASRARGSTNTAVYNRALRDLDTTKATANTDLQNIGGGVLSGITDAIGSRRKTALDAAANWDFGSMYDPNQEADRIRSYADQRRTGLEGDIRGAVGGREFFDVNSLLGKASAKVGNQSTGTTGTGTSALFDTFENEATKKNQNVQQNEGIF
jgi:hypothetical protein